MLTIGTIGKTKHAPNQTAGRSLTSLICTFAACWFCGVLTFVPGTAPAQNATQTAAVTPERRAIDFLSAEVPRWQPQHKCYSCHNNGDAARALYSAINVSYTVDGKVLADTSRWLANPGGWKDNGGGKGPFNDTKLAAIQFAAALAEAVRAGVVKDHGALVKAAALVASTQEADGSWKVDAGGLVGSPVTYGRCLATSVVRRLLQQADPVRFKRPIARADHWLRTTTPKSVLDAAAVLLAVASSKDDRAIRQRKHCIDLLRRGQAADDGWGAFVTSATEPFDTAVVLLALSKLDRDAEVTGMLARGRAYLIDRQLEDGSWIETTRPAAGASYAQRLSTAGWATMALLATRPRLHQRSNTSR